eukprot:CAMPEP_0194487918 /NCGR_PEP_ID=MMETSP0253-20130528/8047_1 /TAXON_ID=2966 /ORGANISM="Noctiluca scintillans" /LENGTH=54 /DNA_ID=CAMNT_0039328227 /DNA_START=602 /DNA_END=763 /DNA_ORIENTATION=+
MMMPNVAWTVAPIGTCKAHRGMCHVYGDTRTKERPKKGRGRVEGKAKTKAVAER